MTSLAVAISSARSRQRHTGRIAPTLANFAAFMALGLTTGSLGPTLPNLAAQTNVSLRAISYLFTARSLGYVLGSMRVGRLFDSKPSNTMMSSMLIMAAVATAMVPLANYLPLLLTVMLLLGAAEGAIDVGANTLLARIHGTRVAPFMSAMHSFFGVGALLAPIIVAQMTLAATSGTHSYFVLALLVVGAAIFTLHQPNLKTTPVKRQQDFPASNRPAVFLVASFLFLYVGAEVGFAGWVFTYAVELRLAGPVAAAYITSMFWGSLTIGRVAMIPVAARVKPSFILIMSLAGSLLSLSSLIFVPYSLTLVWLATFGFGLSMASIFPATLSLAGLNMKITGKVTGWFVTGSSLGAILIPLIIGQLLQALGPRAIVFVTALTLLVGAGVLALVITSRPAGITNQREAMGETD